MILYTKAKRARMEGNLSDDRILISPSAALGCSWGGREGGEGRPARPVQFSDRLSVSQKPKLGLIFNVVKGGIAKMKTLRSAPHPLPLLYLATTREEKIGSN